MCGITGIYAFDPARPIERSHLVAMTDALIHRGPDDEGFHAGNGIALGFRRLAIVDPRPLGNQPIVVPGGGGHAPLAAVVNGEIYNHAELRAALAADGVRLRSQCDTEVVPHLYRRHGAALLDRLDGQFALAVHDPDEHRLLLARDPVGVCPLFWCEVDGLLLFGSEIKALLRHPAVRPALDPAGLDQVLSFPGLVSPRTAFAGIRSLPPGHCLLAGPDGITVRSWWDLDFPVGPVPTPPDWEDELIHRLEQSVARRLQADVPVGFYLSGGLDSSLIAALIHRLRPGDAWQAFSINFDDPGLDEHDYQREVAQRIGARHQRIDFSARDLDQRLRAVIAAAETPLRESYDTCSHALSAAVRDAGCKVVLSGEGADELFAGYVGYRFDALRSNDDDDGLFDEDAWAESLARETLWGDDRFFYERDYAALRDTRRALYAPALAARFDTFDCTAQAIVDPARLAGRHPLHQRAYVDFKLRIADHLLADHGDRMTFAHSVEGRYPFLDAGLIRFVTQLPPDLLLADGREKYPLRRIARGLVPERILAREKFAFVAPSSPALLARAEAGDADWVADLLAPERIRRQGVFDPAMVARLRTAYLQPGFALNQTFETDLMMVVLSYQLLADIFSLPDLT